MRTNIRRSRPETPKHQHLLRHQTRPNNINGLHTQRTRHHNRNHPLKNRRISTTLQITRSLLVRARRPMATIIRSRRYRQRTLLNRHNRFARHGRQPTVPTRYRNHSTSHDQASHNKRHMTRHTPTSQMLRTTQTELRNMTTSPMANSHRVTRSSPINQPALSHKSSLRYLNSS